MNRRGILLSALALTLCGGRVRGEDSGAAGGADSTADGAQPTAADKHASSVKTAVLRILILGGTGFIGPHFVREARSRGHALTLFNRGRTAVSPTPGVETLIGDRDGQIAALEGRDWDVVIDNSGFVPRQVRLTTRLLRDHVRHYLFVSTVAVYSDLSAPDTTEDAPLKQLADETVEEVSRGTYGGLKALCERVVNEDFAGRSTILRPSFIAGPGDDTDRFTYWPWRMALGGEMLAPGTPADPIQYVDVRDLARFVLDCVEAPRPGTFNVCTPPGYATIGALLDACRRVTGAQTKVQWVGADFLAAQGVLDGPGLPIWRPPSGPTAGVALVSPARGVAAGLRFTPLDETVRDTWDWQRARPAGERDRLEAGLSHETEAALLARYRTR